MAAPIYFHKEPRPHTANVYRLVGRNEDALTYALGHLMAIDDGFMLEVLKGVGVLQKVQGKQYKAYRENYTVYLQEQRDAGPSGRRDIVVEAGGSRGLRVVVEAKIGKGQPDACQLLRYTVGCHCGRHPPEAAHRIQQTWGDRKQKFIVALTRYTLDSEVCRRVLSKLGGSGIGLRTAQWHQILTVALDRRRQVQGDTPQSLFLGEFVNFFREHYEMNTYQAEVMVKKDDPLNAKDIYFDGYMYVGDSRDIQLPLYFAPYFTKQCVGEVPGIATAGLSLISRVIRLRQVRVGALKENPESAADYEIRADRYWERWQRGLHAIAQRARDERWPDKDRIQLYFLSEPASLNRTVVGPRQIPPGFKTTLFDLLTKDTLVRESLA
jgi:hypothetical protein